MAWTSPRTWTNGEVVDQTILNTAIRDNLLWLGGTGGIVTQVAAQQGGITATTSASLVDTGFTQTLSTRGGVVLLLFSSEMYVSVAGTSYNIAFALDGSTQVNYVDTLPTTGDYTRTFSYLATAVSAASHTFKIQWSVAGGATLSARGTNERIFTVLEFR